MGACYDMRAKIRFTVEENEKKCVEELINYFNRDVLSDSCMEEVKNIKTIEDAIKFVGAEHQGMFDIKVQKNGFIKYNSSFDASYSWWSVLYEASKIIKKHADVGSYLKYDIWE